MKIKALVVLLAIVLLAGPSMAGTTGKIAGRIADKNTGQGLPFATVQAVGTGLGA